MIPLARGGTDYIGNIVPACGKCNSSKNASTVTEWRLRRAKENNMAGLAPKGGIKVPSDSSTTITSKKPGGGKAPMTGEGYSGTKPGPVRGTGRGPR